MKVTSHFIQQGVPVSNFITCRFVVALSATLVACSAVAQGARFGGEAASQTSPFERVLTGSGISPTRATMVFYSRLANANAADAEALRSLSTVANLNQDAVAAYVEYAKKTLTEKDSYERAQRVQALCNKRDEIKTNDQLTAVLVQIDSSIESKAAQLIAGSESVLGADRKRMLDNYILGTRNSMKIVEVDPMKVARYGTDQGMSIADITAKMCKGYWR